MARVHDPLDNAVWHALIGPLASFAEQPPATAPRTGDLPAALRFAGDVAPFAALPDDVAPGSWDALAALAGPGGVAALFRAPLDPPATWQSLMHMPCVQMVCDGPCTGSFDGGVARRTVELGKDDRADMLALTAATRPGPFTARTHELGRYVGVRDGDRLIAMAGERLRIAGATEVSAVCTDPAHQRRGLAAALVADVVARIAARGERAFLHVADDNHGARRVYEALGFRRRTRIDAHVLRAPG